MANLATVKAKVAEADAAQGTGGLLTRKVDAAAGALLRKKLNPNQKWDVRLIVDRSGSMGRAYPAEVQNAINSTLGFSVLVDDDGTVPTIFFDDRLHELDVRLDDFHGLVAREHIGARGTTDLTGALRRLAVATGNGDVLTGTPVVKKAEIPTFAIVIFDGAPDDPRSATDVLRRLSYRAIEVKIIFVGPTHYDRAEENPTPGWAYVKSLDDDIPVGPSFERGHRLFDNIDAKSFASLVSMTDAELYDAMFDEVPGALQAMKANGLL